MNRSLLAGLGLLSLLACSTRGTLGIEPDAQPSPSGAPNGGAPPGTGGMTDGGVPGATPACGDELDPEKLTLIELANLGDCEVLSYPLAFLTGEAESSEGSVEVELGGTSRSFPIYDHRFKALVQLERGTNHLRFTLDGTRKDLRIIYEPPPPPTKLVRLFVYLGSDGTGDLDAPPGVTANLQDALARVRLDGLLWQSFFAEAYRRSRQHQGGSQSFTRQTFALELDDQDQPVVHVIRHDTMTQQQLWARNDGVADWGDVVRLVNRQTEWPVADSLHIGFSLVTHVDPATGESYANVCAGNGDPSGGGVGLCGGGNLIAHAASLDEVVASFSNSAPTDPMYIAEDSHLRGSYWAAYATTLGCALEEGLRGLGLPYTPTGLFSPDCGNINRFFMPYEIDEGGARLAVTDENEISAPGADWFHPDIVSQISSSPFVQ